MFNSVFYGGDSLQHVNAVSGGIVKNHPQSYFRTFHLKSTLAEQLLSDNPHIKDKDYNYQNLIKYVEVLQLVLVGDMQVVAEIIDLPKENK